MSRLYFTYYAGDSHPPQLLHPVLLTFIMEARFFRLNIFPADATPLLVLGATLVFAGGAEGGGMKPNIFILIITDGK